MNCRGAGLLGGEGGPAVVIGEHGVVERGDTGGVGDEDAELAVGVHGGAGVVDGAHVGVLCGEAVVGKDGLGMDVEAGGGVGVGVEAAAGLRDGGEARLVAGLVDHGELHLHAIFAGGLERRDDGGGAGGELFVFDEQR